MQKLNDEVRRVIILWGAFDFCWETSHRTWLLVRNDKRTGRIKWILQFTRMRG